MLTLVTGAAGFVGRAVVRRLLDTRMPDHAFRLVDRAPLNGDVEGAEVRIGDLGDPAFLDQVSAGANRVIHLAALPGGASEADYAQSRRVNLETSLALIDRMAEAERPVRFVYASSIAVFDAPSLASVDDTTPPRATSTYGAHKLMVETALANLTRLGRIEGLALRLPGLVARPRAPSGLKSAFMSEVFHALAAGESYTVPVSPDATVWITSVEAAAQALIHAASIPWPGLDAATLTLPALRVSLASLVRTVAETTHAPLDSVHYAPDAELEQQFGRLPPLSTPLADRLGFRHDGDLEALVRRALTGVESRAPS